jgi:hypothetical protein
MTILFFDEWFDGELWSVDWQKRKGLRVVVSALEVLN